MGSQRLFSGPSEKSLPPTSSNGGRGGSAVALALPYPEQFCPSFFPEGDAGQEKPRAAAASPAQAALLSLLGLQGPRDWNTLLPRGCWPRSQSHCTTARGRS